MSPAPDPLMTLSQQAQWINSVSLQQMESAITIARVSRTRQEEVTRLQFRILDENRSVGSQGRVVHHRSTPHGGHCTTEPSRTDFGASSQRSSGYGKMSKLTRVPSSTACATNPGPCVDTVLLNLPRCLQCLRQMGRLPHCWCSQSLSCSECLTSCINTHSIQCCHHARHHCSFWRQSQWPRYLMSARTVSRQHASPIRVIEEETSPRTEYAQHPFYPHHSLCTGKGHHHSWQEQTGHRGIAHPTEKDISCNPMTIESEGRLADICHHFRRSANIIMLQGTGTKDYDGEGQAESTKCGSFMGLQWGRTAGS